MYDTRQSFLYTAEQRTHVTDKTLNISGVCLSVEPFNMYKKKKNYGTKNLNISYCPFNSRCSSVPRVILLFDYKFLNVIKSVPGLSERRLTEVISSQTDQACRYFELCFRKILET